MNFMYIIGRSTITVVSFAPYSWFSQWSELTVKKRGDEYNAMKNVIGQQIIDQVVHLYPDLRVKSRHLKSIQHLEHNFHSF